MSSLLPNVKMNVSKLRTFDILRGLEKRLPNKLAIHGEGWNKVLVGINHEGNMTHLGVIWNTDLNNDKQFEAIKEALETVGSRILRHKGRVGDKLLALEYCLRSTIVYRMQYCIWGLDRYNELDKVHPHCLENHLQHV